MSNADMKKLREMYTDTDIEPEAFDKVVDLDSNTVLTEELMPDEDADLEVDLEDDELDEYDDEDAEQDFLDDEDDLEDEDEGYDDEE